MTDVDCEICSECGVHGRPLSEIRVVHKIIYGIPQSVGVYQEDPDFEQGTPVVTTMWRCAKCRASSDPVVSDDDSEESAGRV